MILALLGNQNCGKTTLFNLLTGSNQHVGNFPGITVEQKFGILKKHPDVKIVDLPGIYSLTPYTEEEIITRDFVLHGKPDGLINILDATNLERHLYLTLQLANLGIPMILALNMMDELAISGGEINTERFSEELGIPTVPISAAKKEGIGHLITTFLEVVQQGRRPPKRDFGEGPIQHCTKHCNKCNPCLEKDGGIDPLSALVERRYSFIESLCQKTVRKPSEHRAERHSQRMDYLLTHKIIGIPLFFSIMFLVFWLTFHGIGTALSNQLARCINFLSVATEKFLSATSISPLIQDLILHGIFPGVGSVLSFLPIILTLFFFLSLLEDSGYMARISFMMDQPMRRLGLSGKSIVPLLIGFGCSVPAILATRTLAAKRDRLLTILLIPMMSCSAKLPVYALFAAAFFPRHAALVMMGLYLSGVLLAILFAYCLKRTTLQGPSSPFLMELPPYRFPSLKNVALLLGGKTKDFLQKAFTLIFAASIILWFFQTFDLQMNQVHHPEESMLAGFGNRLSLLLQPLGLGNWQIATALLSGFVAKEAVLGTLGVLTGSTPEHLPGTLQNLLTTHAAISFLVFTLLYTPCIAAIATVKSELGTGWSLGIVFFQLILAWLCALGVYHLSFLFW